MEESAAGVLIFVVALYLIFYVLFYALAIGAAIYLIYLLIAHIIVPLSEWLGSAMVEAADDLYRWYREVTWQRRMQRSRDEAIAAIDAARREQVARVRRVAQALEIAYQAGPGAKTRQPSRQTNTVAAAGRLR